MSNEQEVNHEYSDGYSYCKFEDDSHVEYHRKAFENAKSPAEKKLFYSELVYYETHRDYHGGSIKEFRALSQVDTPDLELIHKLRSIEQLIFYHYCNK